MTASFRSRQPELPGTLGPPGEWVRRGGGSPRLLTPVYGSLRRAFSGSTWYLARAGLATGVLDGAFTLNDENQLDVPLWSSAAAWKVGRMLRGRKSGGYKFVAAFHDRLWSRHLGRFEGATIINNTQVFGPFFLDHFARFGITPGFYVDGTLTDYFGAYGRIKAPSIGADMIARAIEMERDGYARARFVLAMSHAAAGSLIAQYGVDPARIGVVTPGANIDDEAVPAPSPHTGWIGREFTLGFVGLFPRRKGLDRLADAVAILRQRRLPIRLRVIGRCPPEIAAADGVDDLGEIDKATDTARFVQALRTVDLGCQMSRAELLGIAVLEFIRLGVPVLATAVGGIVDVLEAGGGLTVPADITAEALAAELQALMEDGDRYRQLRSQAVRRAAWASWTRAAADLERALTPTAPARPVPKALAPTASA